MIWKKIQIKLFLKIIYLIIVFIFKKKILTFNILTYCTCWAVDILYRHYHHIIDIYFFFIKFVNALLLIKYIFDLNKWNFDFKI